MANPVFIPIHPHFFQPLLPGFHRHLTVPVTFFMRHMKGIEEPNAVLRSELGEKRWKVKMEGRRFTYGWEEFVVAHGFKVGDVLVFRHECNSVFHVTAFGPSGFQIQYAPFHSVNDAANHLDDDDIIVDTGDLSRNNGVKKSLKTETDPLDHTCFRAVVTASSLRSDTVYLPMSFVRQNGLNKRNGEIVLMNRHGRRLWKLHLRHSKRSDRVYIRRGWRDFCDANGQGVGDSFRLKFVRRGKIPVLRMCPAGSGNEDDNDGSVVYLKTQGNAKLSANPGRNSKECSGECSKIKEKKAHRSKQGV